MLKVVVNSRFLTQPMTGVQQYALKLSNYLKENLKEEVCFVSPKGIEHTNLAKKLDVKEIGNTKGFFWEQVELPFWLKRENSPLLINFGNVAPQYYSNQIVTIHDLATLEHPEWFSGKFSRAYKFMIPQVVKSAKRVIAVSEFTKRRIHELLEVDVAKIEVIYNSVDSIGTGVKSDHTEKYFLSVGSFSGRKNFMALVKAFQQANLPDFKLKIRGDVDGIYKGGEELEALVNHDERIQFIEPLNYAAYLALVQNANALINTSMYEGFGMPNLEALSLGVPVICSDIEVFKEISGPCATYFNPEDSIEMARLLRLAAEQCPSEMQIKHLQSRSSMFKTEIEGKKLVALISQCLNSLDPIK